MAFSVIHSNVDGAGTIGEYTTYAEAKDVADSAQRAADASFNERELPDGRVVRDWNPYRYTYTVFGPGGSRWYATRASSTGRVIYDRSSMNPPAS